MAIMRTIGWLGVLAATAAVWASRRPPEDPYIGLRVARDLAYGSADGRPLRLDLLLPGEASAGLRPLVVAVHGGGWTGGSRRIYAPQFADFARRGLAVAVIDYRLARPGAPSWDGALKDVRVAVDWLVDRADRFGIDRERVATLGTSSGGLLAIRAAQVDSRIAAAVGLSAPSSLADLAASRNLEHDPVRDFLGVDPADDPELAAAASPLDHVAPGGPAVLLIHGEDDARVPVDQARQMHEKLGEAGVARGLLVIPGVRHGFELKLGGPDPLDLTPIVADFLAERRRKEL